MATLSSPLPPPRSPAATVSNVNNSTSARCTAMLTSQLGRWSETVSATVESPASSSTVNVTLAGPTSLATGKATAVPGGRGGVAVAGSGGALVLTCAALKASGEGGMAGLKASGDRKT